MKLIILAAGKGERLWPLTRNTPKSLIDLGDGTTILERQLKSAILSGIFNEVVIVTGYKSEQIEAKIKDYLQEINISILFNPFFDKTNNFVSLWFAHSKMYEEDFMITNGDNIYKDGLFSDINRKVAEISETIQITIDFKDFYDEDDMKVILDNNRKVLKVHKEIPQDKADAESVGLAIVKGMRLRRVFINKLNQLIRHKEFFDRFWLEIFNALIEDGYPIETIEVDRDDWREIDFHPDVDVIRQLITAQFKEQST